MCVIMTDSRCCMAETDSTVKIKKMIIIFNLLKKKTTVESDQNEEWEAESKGETRRNK